MRIQRKRLNNYLLFNRRVEKDNEGHTSEVYKKVCAIPMIVWPAGGKVQAEQYGKRLHYIKNAKVDGAYTIEEQEGKLIYKFNGFSLTENDGIALYSKDKADYKIVAIKPYRTLYMELEKL